jgi:single-strand DNA-binding protein
MSDVNHWTGTGRLGRPPEKRITPSGGPLADFTIANNRYSRKGDKYTAWIRVVVWGKPAEWVADNLDTGDKVFIEGQLVDDDFERVKGDPSTKTKGRLKIDNAKVTLLEKAKPKSDAGETAPAPTQA